MSERNNSESLKELTKLVKKVDKLGKSGEDLTTLTKEEITMIIRNVLAPTQSKYIEDLLYEWIPTLTHTPGWSCSGLEEDIEEDNELSFYSQLSSKIYCFWKKYYEKQDGGGDCSLCGSPGTNKSTCPRNPDAKNPNPDKHPNASAAAVRANSVKDKLTTLVEKVEKLGRSGKNLKTLTEEEIKTIINNSLAPTQSKYIINILHRIIPAFTHTPGWSCSGLEEDIEEDNELSFYAQVLSKVHCYYLISETIVKKVDNLGKENKNLQKLTKEEVEYIIAYSTAFNLSSERHIEDVETLKTLIPNTKFRKGWINCFTNKLVKDEEESFFSQLVSRIQCYLKYRNNIDLIDVPSAVVIANSLQPPVASVKANSVKPVVAQKGKTAPKNDDRGCVEQSDKKYRERPSPPFPANQCCGEKMKGNDGRMYESRADKNGTCKWYALK